MVMNRWWGSLNVVCAKAKCGADATLAIAKVPEELPAHSVKMASAWNTF